MVVTPDGYLQGERSFVADHGPMRFRAMAADVALVDAAKSVPAGARLLWFNHHFARVDAVDGRLRLTDLRMGSEPDYTFRFDIAERGEIMYETTHGPETGYEWIPITPEQLKWPWNAADRLPAMWALIRREPVQAVASNPAGLDW